MSTKKIHQLHELISSLNRSEKRHFKLKTQEYGAKAEKSYLILFDFLDRCNELNKEDINLFRKENASLQLSTSLTYLKRRLLSSLKEYHLKSNSDLEIIMGLADVTLLQDKYLFNQANDSIKNLIKNTEDDHDLNLELLLLFKQYALIDSAGYTKTSIAELEKINKKLISLLDWRAEHQKLLYAYSKMSFYWMRQIPIDEEIEQIFNGIDKSKVENIDHFLLKFTYYNTHAVYSLLKRDGEAVIANFKKVYLHLKKYPKYIKRHPMSYASAMANYLSFTIRFSDENCDHVVEEYKNYYHSLIERNDSKYVNLSATDGFYSLLLTYYSKKKLYTQITELQKEYENHLFKLPETRDTWFMQFCHFAEANFYLKNYKKANYWWDLVEEKASNNLPRYKGQYQYLNMKILQLAIRYQNGDLQYLKYEIPKAQKKLVQFKKDKQIVEILVKMLRDLIGKRYQGRKIELLEGVKAQLKDLDSPLPVIEIFLWWIENEIESYQTQQL